MAKTHSWSTLWGTPSQVAQNHSKTSSPKALFGALSRPGAYVDCGRDRKGPQKTSAKKLWAEFSFPMYMSTNSITDGCWAKGCICPEIKSEVQITSPSSKREVAFAGAKRMRFLRRLMFARLQGAMQWCVKILCPEDQKALSSRDLTVHVVSSSFQQLQQFSAAKKKNEERRKLLQTICTVKPHACVNQMP